MRGARLTRALIVLLVILSLVAGIIGAVAWAYFRYPNHPVFVFLSGATATPTPMWTPTITPSPSSTWTPSPTSSPTLPPTPTFTAPPQTRPTRRPSPTPTPEPTVVLPPEAVPLSGGIPLPMDLYFIRDGGLWRWSEQGQLELLVAPPQQSSTNRHVRARYVTGGPPRPIGVTNYRISPDGRFVIYSYTRRVKAEYHSEIQVLVRDTGENLYLPTTALLPPSSPMTPDIEIAPDGSLALYLAWGTHPTVLGHLVVETGDVGGYGTIFAVDPRNPNREYELGYCAGRRRIFSDWGVEKTLPCRGFVLSPDGTRVAFLDGRGIWVSDFSGSPPRLLAEHPNGFCGIWHSLQWSPDGKYLLADLRCYEGAGLIQIEVETGVSRRIHSTWRHVGFVTASLTGGNALLVGGVEGMDWGYLDRVPLDALEDTTSLLSAWGFWPTYPKELPDGRIALANQRCREREGPAPGIYTVDSDGQNLHFVTPLPDVSCWDPDFGEILWSPDGRAYLYLKNGRPLLLGLTDGSALWDVQELLSGAHTFQWRPPYVGYIP